MMRYYIDTMILIYFLEQTGHFHTRAASRLAILLAAGDEMAVSDLVRMECRVGPLRSGNRSTLGIFDVFFARPDIQIIPATPAVFDQAAQIRASYGFKTPDSIHLAAAVESGCDRFLTHDARLSRFTGITVEIMP
jgi:predicted nucleic acid-binding protein